MSMLIKEQVLPVKRYIASFALPPSYSSDGFPMRARLDEQGNLANSAPLTDARITEAQISEAAQKNQRGALARVSESDLAKARAGDAGKASKLKGLAPSQVDLVDRKFRGRADSLGLSEPSVSTLYQGYITQPSNPAAERKRKSVSDKRATTLARDGKPLTVDSLLNTSAKRQATATRSNVGGARKDVAGLSSVDSAARQTRQQALIASKDLDEFYSKLNSGVPVTAEEQLKGRNALQTLLDQKRNVKTNVASSGTSPVTPLEDLLSSSRKIDYLTANARPVSIPLSEPAQERVKARINTTGKVPSYVKDSTGQIDTTRALYTPAKREAGKQSAIARRAERLGRAQNLLTAAERSVAEGGSIDDSVLYSLAGNNPNNQYTIPDPWGPGVIPKPNTAETPVIPRVLPITPAPSTSSNEVDIPGLGTRVRDMYNRASAGTQNYVQGVKDRWAQIPPPQNNVVSDVPTTAPDVVPPRVITPSTAATTVPSPQNIKGNVTLPNGGVYSAELEVPTWLRGGNPRTPVKKPQPLQVNATQNNIPGELLDTVRSRIGSLSPDNKNLALAGLLGLGGVGMLAGGSLLGKSRQGAQAAREQELNDIARRPPDAYAGYGSSSPYLNQQYPGY